MHKVFIVYFLCFGTSKDVLAPVFSFSFLFLLMIMSAFGKNIIIIFCFFIFWLSFVSRWKIKLCFFCKGSWTGGCDCEHSCCRGSGWNSLHTSEWKNKCLHISLCVCANPPSPHLKKRKWSVCYSMLRCSLLMHILYLPTAHWCISRSYGHPLVLSSLETGG